MKNRFNFYIAVVVMCVLGIVFSMVPAFAQDANQVLSSTRTELVKIGKSVINVLSVLGGIVGAVMVIPNGYKYFKGDPSSDDALMKIGAGILIIVVILQLINLILLR